MRPSPRAGVAVGEDGRHQLPLDHVVDQQGGGARLTIIENVEDAKPFTVGEREWLRQSLPASGRIKVL